MALPRNVLLLAAASLLADVSGEMLMAVFPFLLAAQGATGIGLGLAGGAADAVGHLVKPLGGAWADRTKRRKPLIIAGYLTAAVSRIGIALASFWALSGLFRAADRVGKGLRTAPRDALLVASVDKERRGRAFGLHRAADTAGAVLGAAIALALLAWAGWSPSRIVLAGAFVGLLTLAPLTFLRDRDAEDGARREVFEPASARYRAFLLVAGLFALGQVSYLFFLVRAADAWSVEGAVGLYLLFNVVYLGVAYPAGRLGDRVGRPPLLAVGFLAFGASAALLVADPSLPIAVAAFALMGVAYGFVDGIERAFAADLAGSAARGTRLGVYSAVVGVATVIGGLVAGALWDAVGAWATFAWSVALSLLAALLLFALGFPRRTP